MWPGCSFTGLSVRITVTVPPGEPADGLGRGPGIADGGGWPGREAAMTWQALVTYCLAKPGPWRDEPWEGEVVAKGRRKVGSKIFAFLGSPQAGAVGLKCGPNRELADEWLLRYPGDASVMAYIGRSGWNSLRTGGAIPGDELLEAIDASYDAVVAKLPKKDRPPSG